MGRDVKRHRRLGRGGYGGPVEVWLDGARIASVTADLRGYVDQFELEDDNGTSWDDGVRSWGGTLVGLPDHMKPRIGKHGTARIRTPDGRAADVMFSPPNRVNGTGAPPFDM